MGSPEHKQKIWKLISGIGTGMLVTEDDTALRSRPMQLVQDDYDGTLWFFTRVDSSKTIEIWKDQHVCLTFTDPKERTFVSLSGKAKVTWDHDLKNKYWNSLVSPWFPEGKDSDNCALLEIKIEHGQHWDSDTTKVGFIYEMTKAKLTGERPNLGENQKF